MAIMNWKQNVGIENLDAEKAKYLLTNFRYATSIDNKGKLRINCGASDIKLGFEPNGSSTTVGVTSTPMKPWAMILFIILLCCFVIPGVILSLIISANRKRIYIEAIHTMNQNVVLNLRNNAKSDDISTKTTKPNELKNQGIISETIDSSSTSPDETNKKNKTTEKTQD